MEDVKKINKEKSEVFEFWNEASCGESLLMKGDSVEDQFKNQMNQRYALEPYIIDFAQFSKSSGKKVLEIGVGLGADHQMFAENNAILTGIDLTPRAIDYTKKRLQLFHLKSELVVGDAERLQFPDNSFDVVYSWGVIHHSPKTEKAVAEIYRVLNNNGEARIMIYHKYSFVGYFLWIRYALLCLKPFTSLEKIYSSYLESPGTKAYSKKQARALFKDFKDVAIQIELSHGDLLSPIAGQRHQGILLQIARKLWPRRWIQKLFPSQGLFMLIAAKKRNNS